MCNIDPFFFIFRQEAVVIPPYVAFAIRPNPGFWEFIKVSSTDLSVEGITASDYLKYKEMLVDEDWYINYLQLVTKIYFISFQSWRFTKI